MGATLSRVAGHSAEEALLLDQLAKQDFVAEPEGGLGIPHLKTLDVSRQRNLLRYWIKKSGLLLPDTVHLQRIIDEVIPAAADGTPCVGWTGAEIRRYRDRLYAMEPLPPHNDSKIHDWDMRSPLRMADGCGTLSAIPAVGRGIKRTLCRAGKITVRFR